MYIFVCLPGDRIIKGLPKNRSKTAIEIEPTNKLIPWQHLDLPQRVCKAMETTSAETKTISKQYESKSLKRKNLS